MSEAGDKVRAELRDEVLAKMRQLAAQAMELGADSVQVFATITHANGETSSAQHGLGNWYARAGVVREWLEEGDERTREGVREDPE